jgi:C-terminal processing protease CtpA/Prc
MSRLQGTRGLLIDVRRNGGGDQSGDAILARLATSAVTRYEASERLSDFLIRTFPDRYLLQFNPGDAFAQWHGLKVNAVEPSKRYGDKPVVALISTDCFSACDTFASALKVNRLATLVGEPTGGGTGTPLVIGLPVTQQMFRYSAVRGRTADGAPIEGVGTEPDVLVEPTVKDRVTGSDSQLVKALKLLAEKANARSAPAVASAVVAVQLESESLAPVWAQDDEVSPTRASLREQRRVSGAAL